jgi:hypothetical protein
LAFVIFFQRSGAKPVVYGIFCMAASKSASKGTCAADL